MRSDIHERVLERVRAQFDVPVIQNNLRGLYVEFMVGELLGKGWAHNGSDWAAYDFSHENGVRLEVKQSAARQTWEAPKSLRRGPSFSVRTPKVEWIGSTALPRSRRVADIYVFAWHGSEAEDADQRDSDQWQFFVVSTGKLPAQATVGLSTLRRLANPIEGTQLKASVEALLNEGPVQ